MKHVIEFIEKEASNCKVAIVGSRDFPREDLVLSLIGQLPKRVQLVSGGSGMVDLQVNYTKHARKKMGSPDPIIHYPKYSVYGGKRGPVIRNGLIVAERPCCVVIFMSDPFQLSNGSADVYRKAKRAGIPVFLLSAEE